MTELAAPQEHTPAYPASPLDITDAVFISNIEVALGENGRSYNGEARKVREISSRAIWYSNFDAIVLPEAPDPEFLDYAEGLGAHSKIVIPNGLDTTALAMYDGFGDPQLCDAVHGKTVVSYVPHSSVKRLAEEQAGEYYWGERHEVSRYLGGKSNYREIAEGIVPVAEGETVSGIDAIAEAVYRRLLLKHDVFVRHDESGGGFGLRAIHAKEEVPSMASIAADFEAADAGLWRRGKTLIEEFMPITYAPAISFTAGEGYWFDNLQVLKDGAYKGSWLPTPPKILAPATAERLGDSFGERVRDAGWIASANTDLALVPDRGLLGLEINCRMTGVLHALAIGQLVFRQSWSEWRHSGNVVKSVDHFVLTHDATFGELRATLGDADLLADGDNPYGTVISIPPVGRIAGIHVQGQGYDDTEKRYQRVLELVGDARANQHDNPLFEH